MIGELVHPSIRFKENAFKENAHAKASSGRGPGLAAVLFQTRFRRKTEPLGAKCSRTGWMACAATRRASSRGML